MARSELAERELLRLHHLVVRHKAIRQVTGFGEVECFTVKEGQQEYEIFVDPDVTYDFPLAHLNSQRAGAEPVRVEAESRNAKLVALEIGDA